MAKSKVKRDLVEITMTGEEQMPVAPVQNRYFYLSVALGCLVFILSAALILWRDHDDVFREGSVKNPFVADAGIDADDVDDKEISSSPTAETNDEEQQQQTNRQPPKKEQPKTEKNPPVERQAPKNTTKVAKDPPPQEQKTPSQRSEKELAIDEIHLVNEIYRSLETFISPAYRIYPTRIGRVYRAKNQEPSTTPIALFIDKALRRAIEYHTQFVVEQNAKDSCYIYVRYLRKKDRLLVYLFFRDIYTPSRKRAKITLFYKK